MNRLVLCISLLATVLAAGCGNDARPTYVVADWALRCDSDMGMCSPPPARSFTGENGAGNGNTVSCSVIESADARTVTVTVGGLVGSERYQVEVTAARVPRMGGFAAGGACHVVVTEGGNRFVGACGSAAPSMEQPCQVEVVFDYDDMVMTPTANVRLLCDHLPNESNALILRGLGAPIASPTPAELLFYHCTGLTQD